MSTVRASLHAEKAINAHHFLLLLIKCERKIGNLHGTALSEVAFYHTFIRTQHGAAKIGIQCLPRILACKKALNELKVQCIEFNQQGQGRLPIGSLLSLQIEHAVVQAAVITARGMMWGIGEYEA